jgi:hypothetical protein
MVNIDADITSFEIISFGHHLNGISPLRRSYPPVLPLLIHTRSFLIRYREAIAQPGRQGMLWLRRRRIRCWTVKRMR